MDITQIQTTVLFRGMSTAETNDALNALSAREKSYRKGDVLLLAGDTTDEMGLVLEGSVTVESNDIWGNRTILSLVEPGGFFAETYAYLSNEPLLVDVTANENCRILFLRIGSVQNLSAEDTSSWQKKLISNLLTISFHKNLILSGRSFHTAPKTVRGRLMSYLNAVSLKQGSTEFDIPYNRQQLADYLNVERTALSKELSKMQKDGILITKKNHFKLLTSDF
ncbi:MAG: Crp/Fnr family transcriptional regulator [Ruminococcaceae bacterium]|nr:Crp/Fnr family transcriptional regulator [Oscillospiraceae bacterium]